MASFSAPRLAVIGAGFLGRVVAKDAQRGGWCVIPVVRSQPSADLLRAEFPDVRVADAVAFSFWEKDAPACEAMVWAIAPSRARPDDDFLVMHRQGAVRAADWAGRRRIPFVYISSTSVYAENEGGWVSEDSPLANGDERAVAMKEAEHACLRANGTVLRCAGLYGRERTLQPDGEGPERWLNLVHVEDAARAVGVSLRQRNKVFNVSEDEPRRRGKPGGSWPEARQRSRRNKRVSNRRLRALGWSVVSGERRPEALA